MRLTTAIVCLIIISFSTGCDLFDPPTDEDDGIEGVWVRLPGPSGDRTDLAISGIPGEPSNRVYMCEKRGSTAAGLYKGTYSGNTIVWDPAHGIPNFSAVLVDGQLELDCPLCLPTYYDKGYWSGECGPLESGGTPCVYNTFSGSVNCSNSGYVPVSQTACCPASSPYYCSETNSCYTSCAAADAACSSTTVVLGGSGGGGGGGSSGYNCSNGNCYFVSSGAQFSTQTECQTNCSTSGQTGQFMAWTSVGEYGFPYSFNVMNIQIYGLTGAISGGQYSSAPPCGSTYCFTGTLSPGQYTITGRIYPLTDLNGYTPPTYTTTQTITIYANQCTTVHFQ